MTTLHGGMRRGFIDRLDDAKGKAGRWRLSFALFF
jgi:hypothetical protein